MRLLLATLGVATAIGLGATPSRACPFCTTASQTLSEEIDAMDVVVLARLLQPPAVSATDANDPAAPPPKAKFQAERVLKGDKWVHEAEVLELLAWGESAADKRYLAMAVVSPQLMWSTPLALSQRACEYVLKLSALPKDAARLEFFQDYLEDADEILRARCLRRIRQDALQGSCRTERQDAPRSVAGMGPGSEDPRQPAASVPDHVGHLWHAGGCPTAGTDAPLRRP